MLAYQISALRNNQIKEILTASLAIARVSTWLRVTNNTVYTIFMWPAGFLWLKRDTVKCGGRHNNFDSPNKLWHILLFRWNWGNGNIWVTCHCFSNRFIILAFKDGKLTYPEQQDTIHSVQMVIFLGLQDNRFFSEGFMGNRENIHSSTEQIPTYVTQTRFR